MSDLFPDLPLALSPRLQWLQEHDVKTQELAEDVLWGAWYGDLPKNSKEEQDAILKSRLALCMTEEEAILRLAQKNGWKLWNQ